MYKKYNESDTSNLSEEEDRLPFLHDSKLPDYSQQGRHRPSWKVESGCWTLYLVLLHGLLVAFAIYLWQPSHLQPQQHGSWSPVEAHLEYTIQDSYQMDSVYAGFPTKETKAAWDSLARPIYFNASQEDLQRAGVTMNNRTRMVDGGYLSSLGVLHEMHCLQMFRFFIYFDHYYANVSETQMDHIKQHLDHCLDNIRASLMCQPNTKLITFNWNKPWEAKPEHESNSQSHCVKWSSIENWAKSVGITDNPLMYRVAAVRESDEDGH